LRAKVYQRGARLSRKLLGVWVWVGGGESGSQRQGPRSACKPHSVQRRVLSAWVVIYLGRDVTIAARCGLPGARGVRATPRRRKPPSPLLGLAPDGGCLAAPVTRRAGGLLPHLFTLARTDQGLVGRWRFVSVALSEGLPPPGCYPASCPAECGLSSTAAWPPRPPGRPGASLFILTLF